MGNNALGFGAADWLTFALTVCLVAAAFVWRPFLRPQLEALARNTRASLLLLAALPLVLRILLLPTHPVPTPEVYDEFSHLLEADTLLHFRLANPPHLLPQFFETFFVLQHPTYSSIYPPGQGLLLAGGRALTGLPWAGVLLATAALCSLTYWMLRAWTTPLWSLAGGLLAVFEFGPLNGWTNSYWGGTLPAAAGCLVYGAVARFAAAARKRDALLFGLGIGLCIITRPFESLPLLLSVALYFALFLRARIRSRWLYQTFPYALLSATPFLVLLVAQNKQVTGHWGTLPEQLSQFQYGVPTTLTFQPPATPHHPLTPQQEMDYKAQALAHGAGTDTLPRFLLRFEYRLRYGRFFFLPPLFLALAAFLLTLREPRSLWIAATLALFAFATNFFPYLLPRYLAIVTCLFLLVSVLGLKRLGHAAGSLLLLLCAAHFGFWYCLHLFERLGTTSSLLQYETWDEINHNGPQPRRQVAAELRQHSGRQLVFVRYSPSHRFQDEWVWNAADIDDSPVVTARDLGTIENAKLLQYFPHRTAWLLEPDATPPKLTPYKDSAAPVSPPPQPSTPFIDVK